MPASYSAIDPDHETSVIAAVQRGEVEAFEPLVEHHLTYIRAFIALKAAVPHLVDELAHETFVFAYRNIEDFAPGTSFRSWLRAIAWNLLRAEIQRFSRQQANHARYAQSRFWELTGKRTERQATREVDYLEECIQQTPELMRDLLRLKYREECSSEEIADRLERSLAWVRTTLFRVRQQLKQCIEKKLTEESAC